MTTLRSYIIGFILSIILTLCAPALFWFHSYTNHSFPTHTGLYIAFTVLAIMQLAVQLIFFLHIGKEPKPRWNLTALVFALLIVTILVGGTLWIMNNLSHGQMNALSEPFIDGEISPQTER